MKFTTPVPISPQEPKIDHFSKIFSTGSCFVGNIGKKFDYYKLQNLRNPFGILYHPFAIENFITKAVSGYIFTEEDVFFHNERWHCFDAHSSLSDPTLEKILATLNTKLTAAGNYLKAASHVIITPGTSWVYRKKSSAKTVANCHKLPQDNFTKELTRASEIERSLVSMITSIHKINPEAKVIFTISPVRHLKDGVMENQRSKSHLITAVHDVIDKHPGTVYFPSYEIMMDELRDYRFVTEDLVHPNKIAIDFIWEKFGETWISRETQTLFNDIEYIQKGISHRPFNEKSREYANFQKKLNQRISTLNAKIPHLKKEFFFGYI